MSTAFILEPNDVRPCERTPDELLARYGGLVKRVARRVMRRLPTAGRSVEELELVSTGFIGLLQAAERFDPAAGLSFEAFAEFRVKGAMLDELRRRDFFPRRLRVKATRLERTRVRLERDLGREPSDEELGEATGLTPAELASLRDSVTPYRFVDIADVSHLLDSCMPSADTATARQEAHHLVCRAIDRLPEREALVIRLYFFREQSLREIAVRLSLSIGRISQIKGEALQRLRHLVSN
jgi:RNA polymerase sigma factor FliA